jgi:signal transduction histidine kinase
MPELITENPLVTSIFDQIKTIVDYTHVAIFYVEDPNVTLLEYRGPIPSSQVSLVNFDLNSTPIFSWVNKNKAPLLLADVMGDTPIAQNQRENAGDHPNLPFPYINSWVGIPVLITDQYSIFLDLAHCKRNYYSEKVVRSLQEYVEIVAPSIVNVVLSAVLTQRTRRLEAVLAIQQAIFCHLELREVLQLAADQARMLTSAKNTTVFLLEETILSAICESGEPSDEQKSTYRLPYIGSIIGETIRTGHPLRWSSSPNNPTMNSEDILFFGDKPFMVVPFIVRNHPIGALVARGRKFGFFGPDDENIMTMLASGAGISIENARLYQEEKEKRQIAEEMERVSEGLARLQEQNRIAQALHDTVAQILFRVGLEAKWCEENLCMDANGKDRIRTIQRLVARSNDELRSAIFALRNHNLGSSHVFIDMLKDQVKEFQEESGIKTRLIISPGIAPIPSPITEIIYRILREALTNTRKYAGATGIMISLQSVDHTVKITIQDNGIGLSKEQLSNIGKSELHFGINTMRQLVASVGGTLFIGNNDDHGVMVKANFPLQQK